MIVLLTIFALGYKSTAWCEMNHYLISVAILFRLAHCSGPLCGHNCSSDDLLVMPNSCPPGFDGNNCEVCSATNYGGLLKCEGNRSYVIHGYWVGECKNGTLCTGICPYGFCSYNGSEDYRLPGTVSELDEFICGSTRTGVLCGECRDGYSVNYHSHTYTCTSDDNCKYGWLLYIVSELLPLTVVFVIVIAFNISFTSGAINGFILFAQLQDSLALFGDGVIHLPSTTFYFVIYKLIYRSFNLDFFSIESLSFCLWRGANTLDAIAFKYVTIVTGLALMFICVLVMNNTKLKKLFSCLRPTTLKSSFIHGLTAFFVMCYSQCARVSYHILETTTVTTKGGAYVKTVVFRSGQLSIFGRGHLVYAIPALLFVVTILLLPPFVLIMYPLLGRCLAPCNLSESKFANCISQIIPIQLLDAFQSSFKDKVRFFAGIYYLYRLFPLTVFPATYNRTDFYTTLIVFYICILTIHAVVQPYRKRLHNVIDFLLLANLAVINALSLLNYHKRLQGVHHPLSTLYIQLILIYLPLVCLLIIGFVKVSKFVFKVFKKRCWLRRSGITMLTDSCTLPALREE